MSALLTLSFHIIVSLKEIIPSTLCIFCFFFFKLFTFLFEEHINSIQSQLSHFYPSPHSILSWFICFVVWFLFVLSVPELVNLGNFKTWLQLPEFPNQRLKSCNGWGRLCYTIRSYQPASLNGCSLSYAVHTGSSLFILYCISLYASQSQQKYSLIFASFNVPFLTTNYIIYNFSINICINQSFLHPFPPC